MLVTSSKTAHHIGSESRVGPLFLELRKYPGAAYFAFGNNPAEYVVTRYRDATQNLRTKFEKIIRRAGLAPWPKLLKNLRASNWSSCDPSHVAAAGLGQIEAIGNKHYRQVTDEHFMKACALRKALHAGAERAETEQKSRSR